jgi:membrane associated rhomboid family serine protease
MPVPNTDLLEMILRDCAGARPGPWYPADYVQATGVARDALDAALDQLRMAGLVTLTDWVQGKGQGYALTSAGQIVLERPRLLERLRAGVIPRPQAPRPRFQEERAPGLARTKAVRDALLDRPRPVVTLGLIAANLLMFLVGMAMAQQRGAVNAYLATSLGGKGGEPDPADIQVAEIRHIQGALYRQALLQRSGWWRLVATFFLHVGVVHLVVNMFFLYRMGPQLEQLLGWWRFLLVYMISGLTGSCAAMIFDPRTSPIGASGALCGILAAMLAWVYVNRPYLPRDLAATWIRGILTNVILIVFISLIPGISWSGHFGGGVGGLLAALPLTYNRFGEGPQRWLGLIGALLVPVAAVGWLAQSLAPKTEVERAQQQIAPLFLRAQDIATEAFKQVEPLCQQAQTKKKLDPEALHAALNEAEAARNQLQGLVGTLPSPEEYEDPRIRAALGFANRYVETWIRLFDRFHRAGTSPGGLTAPEAAAVRRLYSRVAEIFDQMDVSVLGLVKTKKQ